MVSVMSTSIAIMDANISIPHKTSVDLSDLHNGIFAASTSSSRLSAVSVASNEKLEDLTPVRSVAMSVNMAKSVKQEVSHLMRVDSSGWDVEITAEENVEATHVQPMATNVNMARSSCSHILPEQGENIVVAVVLSKWDDIMGPQTVHVWLKDNTSALEDKQEAHDKHVCSHEKDMFLMKAIKYVTCHTVNFMSANPGTQSKAAAVSSAFHERNTSLFVIPDLDVVVQSITFSILDRQLSVPTSLALVVHYKHYAYLLNVRQICQLWLRRFTHQLHLALAAGDTGLNELITSTEMKRWMSDFNLMIISLNTCGLGCPRPAETDYDKQIVAYPFIEQALASHLQTLGCSVVMGTSATQVNAMIQFLALFMTTEELFSSRLVHPSRKYSFHMGLFLQGLLLDEFGCRQLSADELAASPYPVTAIDLTRITGSSAVKQTSLRQSAGTSTSMVFTSDNRRSSKLVGGLIKDMKQLPKNQWKQLVDFFMCKVRALARTLLNLAKRNGGHTDGCQLKGPQLQKYLSLAMDLEESDLLIVQAAAEKLEPGSFADVFNSEPNYR